MRFQGDGYRGHDPRFAWQPTSGEGARLHGGRFNPAGTPALYLALSVEGVFAEMGHGFARRFDPLTICSYEVDVEDIADLRSDAGRTEVRAGLADLACPWALDRAEGRMPFTWTLVRRLLRQGAAGILVPSFARGARADAANLVLWRWSAKLPHRVVVHDPRGRLGR